MNMKYQQRIRLRYTMSRLGKWFFVMGFIMLIIGLISQRYIIAAVGQTLLYFGATSIIVFSRVGWSKSRWIDILLNQGSIILTLIGFGILFLYIAYEVLSPQTGVFTVVIGIILAGLGMILQSPTSE